MNKLSPMRMRGSIVARAFCFLLTALVHNAHTLDYSDLEALGLACPDRDGCHDYKNNIGYLDRSCECDSDCDTYRDCCIDAQRRRPNGARFTAGNSMVCMHYGQKSNAGVYVIDRCSSNWNGSPQVREKCEESQEDFSDPLLSAPVTSVDRAVTYRNRYCAECNNAVLSSLTVFQLLIVCGGLPDLSSEQLFADLTYNLTLKLWGVNRMNSFGETQFFDCDIAFNVPSYLNSSVRFCRSNLISSCPQTWTRSYVRRACEEYMAVVFDNESVYRNPHCAICNGKTVDQLTCTADDDISRRKKPISFAHLLDINPRSGDEVGLTRVPTPECEANRKYDPFFKKCRRLVCALPGHVVVNGRCVSSRQ